MEQPLALAVFGGETAYAVTAALGIPALRVVGEMGPGVSICTLPSGADPRLLITKSGGFGPRDLAEAIFHHISAHSAR